MTRAVVGGGVDVAADADAGSTRPLAAQKPAVYRSERRTDPSGRLGCCCCCLRAKVGARGLLLGGRELSRPLLLLVLLPLPPPPQEPLFCPLSVRASS